jgi:hypothetical protein
MLGDLEKYFEVYLGYIEKYFSTGNDAGALI